LADKAELISFETAQKAAMTKEEAELAAVGIDRDTLRREWAARSGSWSQWRDGPMPMTWEKTVERALQEARKAA
jgi:hypothetical protein